MGLRHRTYSRRTRKRKTAKELIASFTDAQGNRKETDIERRVREFLESHGIPFKQEQFVLYNGKWKAYDFCVTDGNTDGFKFFVECDGTLFHTQTKDKRTQLGKIQSKNIRNDKLKNKIAKLLGVPLLRFTEEQIKNEFDDVCGRILKEIVTQVELSNIVN